MKESTLIEMRNQVETLGQVMSRIINDLENLKTLAMGDHQVIKQLKEFPDIIKQMKDEQEKDTSGTATGDSGLIIADEQSS